MRASLQFAKLDEMLAALKGAAVVHYIFSGVTRKLLAAPGVVFWS